MTKEPRIGRPFVMHETILQSVGKTPLVRLRRLADGLLASVYCKVEAQNPGGSVKDRVAMAMVAEAERRGWLRPGGTIIEATAGNTGTARGAGAMAAEAGRRGWSRPGGTIIEATAGSTGVALAMIRAVKGDRCILVMAHKMSPAKIALLKS